ncbi:hypothetical protein [Bernardetia sp.]|uniref:hypothetical protein n=1 Tax=Bernardetia sp. TaxID=1937974 RepID=UPI0025BF8AAD|nr:hypothetical protein [Bernardetia sp.]
MILLVLSTTLFSVSCPKQTTCQSFKVGKFKLSDKKYNKEYLIIRNDSLQIETDLETGKVSKYKVDWESDCKYVLTVLEGDKKVMDFYKDRKLSVEIVELYKNGYKFLAEVEGINVKFYQVLTRIE